MTWSTMTGRGRLWLSPPLPGMLGPTRRHPDLTGYWTHGWPARQLMISLCVGRDGSVCIVAWHDAEGLRPLLPGPAREGLANPASHSPLNPRGAYLPAGRAAHARPRNGVSSSSAVVDLPHPAGPPSIPLADVGVKGLPKVRAKARLGPPGANSRRWTGRLKESPVHGPWGGNTL